MPRLRRTTAPESSNLPVRSSPRKRKQIVEEVTATLPSHDELSSPDSSSDLDDTETRPKKRGRTKVKIQSDNAVVAPNAAVKATATKGAPKPSETSSPSVANTPDKKQRGSKKAIIVKAEENVTAEVDNAVKDEANGSSRTHSPLEGAKQATKVVRKRKTKEEKEAEAMPLAARTQGLRMFVGAHVSIAKGLENAITNSLHIGGNAFALFLKSQRKWENPALKDGNRDAFKHQCSHHQYDQSSHVVPHGSYLVNLASPDKDMSKKSYEAFVDDLHRCEALGIKYYNFHPGSTNKEPLDEAIARLAGNLNKALAATKTVTPLLENMAGHGSIIGSRFSDLRDIIAAVKPEFRSRIGVCIDTCHAFAAGYDLRTPEAFKKTLQDLDDVVGLKYLKAMHINDSKAPFESHRDLHQNIGAGFLGLRAFHNVMNDARLQNVPLILETPCDRPDPKDPKKTIDDKKVWAREIKLLESLIGMDPESEEFKTLEADLSEQGRLEREKMSASITTREDKARKKAERALAKGQKSISAMFSGQNGKRKASVSSSSGLSDANSDI